MAGSARADDAAMARFHHQRASRYYASGQFERAVEDFFRVQELAPSPRASYNIGECFLRLGRLEEAFLFFSEYLDSLDRAQGAAERREYAGRILRERLEPRVARVRVTSLPEGAEIFVDEEEQGSYGRTPRILALPPGRHRIVTALGGHRRAEFEVELVRGEIVEATLEPEAIVGRLRVEASAPARVIVRSADGEIVTEGQTPLEARLPPGGYNLLVMAPGHRDWQRWVDVEASGEQRTLAALEAIDSGGALIVTANVPGAIVELDERPAGFAPVRLQGLSEGPHRIRLTAPQRLEWSGQAQIVEGGEDYLTVMLDHRPHGPAEATFWLGAGGLLSLATGGALAGLAFQSADEFLELRQRGPDPRLEGLHDRTRRLNLAADALIGVGLLALGVAILVYFITDDRGERRSSAVSSTGGQP